MNKSKLIISLFLLSQAVNTCGVYAASQNPTVSEKELSQTVVKDNVSVPQTQSVKAVSDSAVATVDDWEISLEGTTIKINDYVGAEGTEIIVPSLEDFKVRYPTATTVSLTKAAIQSSVRDKSATAFICNTPTICSDDNLGLAFSNGITTANTTLQIVDLSGLDTSNVTDMSYMFNGCSGLTSLDISSFDTSKVTINRFMLLGISSLKSLTLPQGINLTDTDLRTLDPGYKWVAVSDNQKYTSAELVALYDGVKTTSADTYIVKGGNISLKQSSLTKEFGDALDRNEFLNNIQKLTTVDDQDITDTDKDNVEIKVLEHESKTEVPLDKVTQKAGIYDVIYNYNGDVAILTLTVDPLQYTVSFKVETGGSLSGSTSVKVNEGEKVTGLPTVKADSGYTFDGWYDANNNKVNPKTTAITGDTTFTAKFVKNNTLSVTKITMYRLYNPNSGEHFYTSNTYELDQLKKVGWKYEGTAWTAPNQGTPVYRMYNANAGDHHYTTSSYERDQLKKAGWRAEGIGWYGL